MNLKSDKLKDEIKKIDEELKKFHYNGKFICIAILYLIGFYFLYKKFKLLSKKDKLIQMYLQEIQNEISAIKQNAYNEAEKYLENRKNEIEADLHNFTENYLDQNYIERRDLVLLEQLEYSPIEYRYQVSGEYKEQMNLYDQKEKEIIKKNEYVIGSIFKKKSSETKFEKMIVSSFNSLTDNAIQKVSIKNHSQQVKKINALYEQFNTALKLGSEHRSGTMAIGKRILKIKLKKLNLMLEYKHKIEQEKEIIREQREREKEEKKIQNELCKQIRQIDEEKLNIEKQRDTYLKRLEKEKDQKLKDALLEEITKLTETVDQLISSEKTLEEKKKFTSAGYVYIISNIGSFGENIYKIGMTRREEPLDRVKELGDASVPFLFDVHALIYSTNAYELENKLHKEFSQKRVNKVNQKKEFFEVSLSEIENIVINNYNGTVDFIKTPEAIEYRETLLLKER